MKYDNVTFNFISFQTWEFLFVLGSILEDFDVIICELPEKTPSQTWWSSVGSILQ